jgi:FkbM family methyltransferase
MQGTSFLSNILTGSKKAVIKLFDHPFRSVGLNFIDIKILKHLPAGKLHLRKVANFKIHFTNPQEFLHALKEIFVEQCYHQKLPDNALIIDCGSNIGISILYLKKIAPNSRIIAFEPDESNFMILEKNINVNQLHKIELHKAAVWTENTTLSFRVTGSMGSTIDQEKHDTSVKVQALRLKDFLQQKVDFLKIDIEGAEFEVLKDIAPDLHNVQTLFLEYHGTYQQNGELLQILNIVQQAGFKFYIKEAASIYDSPFINEKNGAWGYDVQLNIFCHRISRQ